MSFNNKWILTARQRCDLELLLIGGFNPLNGFLNQADYESVVTNMHLSSGKLWPMPITLDVSSEFAEKVEKNATVELYDTDNTLLARLQVKDKWCPDKKLEALKVFGTLDCKHPGVNDLLNKAGYWYLGGVIEEVQLPKHFDFVENRYYPAALKQLFVQKNWDKVIGFQTRNPMHRAHMELTLRAAEEIGGNILIHPVVGLTKSGDVDYYTRVRCYQKILSYYPQKNVFLSLLPLAMRMGGPREALWHALIRKNYGCTHFIVGRDHAGPGNDSHDKPFYDPYAAQELVRQYQEELDITMIPFNEMVYLKERKRYCATHEIQKNETPLTISGTQLRTMLRNGENIPEWFSFPEIIAELRQSYPPKYQQGLTLFFTGLSGSGKTTLSHALIAKLMSMGYRNVTLLDGDVVRRILANELGFSKADRDLNIRRIGFVASEITKAGGIVICAAIAPYLNARNENRQLISQFGNYVEIYLSTSLSACEKRDPKGLYSKVRKGEIKSFTGIDDPYEMPEKPELTLDTSQFTIDQSLEKIITFLTQENYLAPYKVQVKSESLN